MERKKRSKVDTDKEKKGIKKIDYLAMIDSLSDSAFAFYVEQIFKDLNFKVLKRKDIRKIDIEEKILYRIEFLYYKSLRIKEGKSVKRYAELLKESVEGFVECKEGTRAAAYGARTIEIAERLYNEEGALDDLHDLVFLFICMYKSYKDNGMSEISDINLEVNKNDAGLIRWICEGEDIEASAKGPFKAVKNPVKGLTDSDKEFLLLTTMLYGCILMDENGEFEENA